MSLLLASLWRRSERVFNYTWNRCIMLEWCSFKNVYFLLCLIFLHSTTCCALETLTDLLSPHWNVRGLRGCVWFAAVTWHMAGTQRSEYMNEWTDGGTVQNLFLFLTPLGFPLMEWLPLHCVRPMCYLLIRKARGLGGNRVLIPVPVSPKLQEPNPLPESFGSQRVAEGGEPPTGGGSVLSWDKLSVAPPMWSLGPRNTPDHRPCPRLAPQSVHQLWEYSVPSITSLFA